MASGYMQDHFDMPKVDRMEKQRQIAQSFQEFDKMIKGHQYRPTSSAIAPPSLDVPQAPIALQPTPSFPRAPIAYWNAQSLNLSQKIAAYRLLHPNDIFYIERTERNNFNGVAK